MIDRLAELRGARNCLPHLAFLSCCEIAAPEAEGALGGLAQRLVRGLGMPAVVAMSDRVTVQTATALAGAFYARLRDHGAVDRALSEAYAGLASRPDVAVPVPVLFSRLGGRPLFSNTPDRDLTAAEVTFGLDRLDSLLSERAPILRPAFDASAGVVRESLGVRDRDLPPEAKEERVEAAALVNEICSEVAERDFKALALGQDPPPYDKRCPFQGLLPFAVQDRAFFFGREPLTDRLVRKLENHPFLAVLGPSGSGKSSVVLAGLVPRLVPELGHTGAALLTPGDDPVGRLDTTLAAMNVTPSLLVVDQSGRAVHALYGRGPADRTPGSPARPARAAAGRPDHASRFLGRVRAARPVAGADARAPGADPADGRGRAAEGCGKAGVCGPSSIRGEPGEPDPG